LIVSGIVRDRPAGNRRGGHLKSARKTPQSTYFRLTLAPQNTLSDVQRIGLGLRQLAVMRMYMDDRASSASAMTPKCRSTT